MRWIYVGSVLLATSLNIAIAADVAPPVEKFFIEGRLAEGAAAMQQLID